MKRFERKLRRRKLKLEFQAVRTQLKAVHKQQRKRKEPISPIPFLFLKFAHFWQHSIKGKKT